MTMTIQSSYTSVELTLQFVFISSCDLSNHTIHFVYRHSLLAHVDVFISFNSSQELSLLAHVDVFISFMDFLVSFIVRVYVFLRSFQPFILYTDFQLMSSRHFVLAKLFGIKTIFLIKRFLMTYHAYKLTLLLDLVLLRVMRYRSEMQQHVKPSKSDWDLLNQIFSLEYELIDNNSDQSKKSTTDNPFTYYSNKFNINPRWVSISIIIPKSSKIFFNCIQSHLDTGKHQQIATQQQQQQITNIVRAVIEPISTQDDPLLKNNTTSGTIYNIALSDISRSQEVIISSAQLSTQQTTTKSISISIQYLLSMTFRPSSTSQRLTSMTLKPSSTSQRLTPMIFRPSSTSQR
ncbi:hypothetical protein PPL_05797 [Heterostelium album PN500]|uniref:Uncharacterized protein n=1 Tax=Heterostelium pallidum (strain ATCC 26659 / Pp 5 / PN500) TaxID=670386 RepID=D3BB65_HETP5|nr:hypothetical protein PPL_05797 [Heterostelium album PN500]EFA81802.1 hypothetical protein PPL_05797 [Heterostelium album PN500]|eukprot:XP_020433919.1 hypothetical protein PPL_05797 [Heterostelium album PN500]